MFSIANDVSYVGGPVSSKFLSFFVTLFVSLWMLSNMLAVKLVIISGVTLTGGFFIFPFVTLIGNILTEVYGYKHIRQAIWFGLMANVLFVLSVYGVYLLPSSPIWHLNAEFKDVLLPGVRVAMASIFSFTIAEFLNSYLLSKFKIFTNGRSLFLRVIVACAMSFLLDIVVFLILAFYGDFSNAMLLSLILMAYIKKLICQVVLYPVFNLVVARLKKSERLNIFDNETNFNPFSLEILYETKGL